MLLSDFVLLSPQEKMVILLHDGVVVGRRQAPTGTFYLFQTAHFYSEVFYAKGEKEPEQFNLFTGTGPLEPYLRSISLESIHS